MRLRKRRIARLRTSWKIERRKTGRKAPMKNVVIAGELNGPCFKIINDFKKTNSDAELEAPESIQN